MQPRAGLSMTRISLSFLLVLVGGCSKQIRIKQVGGDERPILTPLDRPINLTIGLVPKEIIRSGKSKRPYASNARELADALAARLRDLHAFRAVYYPLNSDVRPMVEVELESNFFSDAHLGEAKFTGFLVGLSMYAGAPLARIRVDLDSNARLKSTGPKGTQLFETSCRYEARFNPFANVNPHQADIVLGENVVYHLADVLAHHLIQAYGYRSKDIADNLKAGVDAPQRSQQATAEESVGSSKTPWRQLRRGLSVEMTRRLLGAPHETSESRASTIWYYPDVDGGFVAFRNGLVVQWREPVTPPTKPVEEIATTTPATEQPKRHIDKPPTNAVSPELYRVISTEDRPPHWCRYSVRLEKRLSEEELGWIAQKLKRSQGHRYNKTLVFFLLPGMQDAGYWARALFEPDLKIRITGMTAEQEKQALDEPVDASRDSLGRWLNEQPFASSVVEIYRQDGKLIVEHKYKAGFSLTDELIERTVAGQTRYDVRNNSFGEYYVIDSSGNLGICDRDGLITTARRGGTDGG